MTQIPPREMRHDENKIEEFGMTSREGAVSMVAIIIVDNDDDRQALKDQVSLATKAVPIKFAIRDCTKGFVQKQPGTKYDSHRF